MKDLMEKYVLSEIQAQDVLELRLRQLGNLELSSIEKEMKENKKTSVDLNKIVESEKTINLINKNSVVRNEKIELIEKKKITFSCAFNEWAIIQYELLQQQIVGLI